MSIEPYVLLVLTGSSLEGAGGTLQKYGISTRVRGLSIRRALEQPRETVGKLLANLPWWMGVALMLTGAVFTIQGLADGEVSVAVPLGTLSVLVAMTLGITLLGESISRLEAIGIGGMALGTAILVATASPPVSRPPQSTPFLASLGLAVVAVAALLAAAERRVGRRRAELLYALAAGLVMGFANMLVKVAAGGVRARRGSFELLDPADLSALLTEPSAYGAVLGILFGFGITQLAFASGRVSVISPLRLAVQIATAVGLGVLLLGEPADGFRAAAIAALLLSTAALFWTARETERLRADPEAAGGSPLVATSPGQPGPVNPPGRVPGADEPPLAR